MSITVGILQGGTNSHETSSEEVNAIATDFVNESVVGTITNTSGVAPATGGFAVNAQSTPDMTVAVSAGTAYVTGTPTSGNSQTFRVKNSASANVTISANSTGGTRYDWVYISLDADALKDPASDASDVATLVTSRSTSASTDNGTPPTYGYNIAVVTVANGASSITNGNITDKRTTFGINWKNPYNFSAYLNSDQTSVADATQTTVQLANEFNDTNGNYATGSYTYTCPIAGVYEFNGFLRASGTGISDAYVEVYINGSTSYTMGRSRLGGTTDTAVVASGTVQLLMSANDTVVMRGFVNVSSGTATFIGQTGGVTDACKFSGKLIHAS